MNKQIAKYFTITLLAAVFGFIAHANAATTDLANEPMAVSGGVTIKPNVLFLLDDSGSMAWDRLSPDTMANTNSNADFCNMNSTFNGVYYNPASIYKLPVNSTGVSYPNSTFTAAKSDGFDTTSPVITNLSTGFTTGGSNNNAISGPGAFYYTYHSITYTTISVSGNSSTTVSSIKVNGVELMSGTSLGSTNSSTTAANIAAKITMNGFSASSSGSTITILGPTAAASYTPVITKSGTMTISPDSAFTTTPATATRGVCYPDQAYTRVNVTSASTEAQNFANWYSYYRTRILTMKTAVGRAFQNIDSTYRVGFTTINTIDNASPMVVNISDFDATQRATWYSDFYAIVPNSSTPLRVALANAGRMYAHKLPGAADPLQYSCQQNFTIMTTDGMWNETATPKQINGTTDVGNPDATAPRPLYDGSSYTKTTKQNQQNTSIITQSFVRTEGMFLQSSTSNLQSSSSYLQSSSAYLQSSTSNLQKSTSDLQSQTSYLQKSTSNLQIQTGALQEADSTNSGSTYTAWYNVASCKWKTSGGSTRTKCQYAPMTAWSNAASCTTNTGGTGTSGTWTGDKTSCQYTAYSAWANAGSCTTVAQDSTSPYTVATATQCSYTAYSSPVTVSSCTSAAQSASSPYSVGTATQCTYTTYSAPVNASSCTTAAQSSSSPYAGPATTCSYTAYSAPVNVSSCTNVAKSASSPFTVGTATTCSYTAYSAPVNVSSCTNIAKSASSPFTVGTATTCSYSAYSAPVNVSSCTTVAQSASSPFTVGTATTCSYNAWSAWVNNSSCASVPQSASSPYTVGTATQCQNAWEGVSSCPASTTCQTVTGSNPVASCVPGTASSSNNWTTTTCSTSTTPWVGVSSCTAQAASSSNGYVATNCNPANPVTTTTSVVSCAASAASAANSWTTTTCSGLIGGTPNTLADVAYYYYITDLRDSSLSNCTGLLGSDVCANNVRGAGNDINAQQHMTTFTLGLGVVGTLDSTGYYPAPSTSVDYNNLVTGPNNWPAPVSNTDTTIDDLWHAAVNGHGVYFSAKNPDTLVSGLSDALQGVKARQGSSAAASTSNMQPVPGDNYAYVALFTTSLWDGDLLAKEIDPITGQFVKDPAAPSQDLIVWHGQTQLDTLVNASTDTRTIYTFDSTTANKLKPFTWASLNATEQAYFSAMCSSPYKLSQCPTLISNDTSFGTTTATAASGANLVNYLRGQYGFDERVTNTSKIFRQRDHVLGDIVSAQPQYVKKPPFDYTDAGYADFKTAMVNRTAMVYAGANDGMLHALDATTGVEQWAYIPPIVMPNMYKLASDDYSSNHRYFVDGTPTVADICPLAPASTCTSAQWKTILVGGLSGGGRGYYALDITDPANPKALWNFTVTDNANLGYTYGNPVITKRKDKCVTVAGVSTCTGGTWVVAFTSGYNNVSPGDGLGHLLVLNANTGVQLEDIATSAGTTSAPSGLSKINAWINIPGDNTAERFYGGDLLGNVWRIDIDDNVPPAGKEAFMLAQLGMINGATVQPVTIKPELVEIIDGAGTSHSVVQIATGKYLGLSDIPNTDQQSIYSFKDNLTATGLGQVRTTGLLVKQTLTTYTSGGSFYRKSTNNPVDWSTKSGWYVDLNPGGDSPTERVNIDMNMQQTTLQVTSNVPDTNVCNMGGYSWIYYFNFQTGYLAPLAGIKDASNSLTAGTTQIMDATGKTHTIITHTDGTVTVQDDVAPPPVLGVSRRVSWRELAY